MASEQSPTASALSEFPLLWRFLARRTGTGRPLPIIDEVVDVILERSLTGSWASSRRQSFSGDAVSAMTAELSGVVREMASDIAMLKEKLEALTLTVNELRAEIADRPIVRSLVLHDLASDVYRLRQPLAIVIEECAAETIASLPEIEAFGVGASEPEALGMLELEIIALYEQLHASDSEELGLLPRKWLRILDMLLERRPGAELQVS